MPQPRVPVVMYHSVGPVLPGWIWNTLTIGTDQFEKQIMALKQAGYRSISLDELRDIQAAGTAGSERVVALTFDDGYLDNWVAAYPILKREGWQGTIYVNPDFVDPGEEPRRTMEDVWAGRCANGDLQWHGFLNKAELKLLEESGVMVIASHSMTHTWYPTGPEVVDSHRPDLDTPWLAWNERPERKYAYLTEDQSGFVPFGTPIHEHERALGIRRFFPDGGNGRYETDQEMEERFRYEILESRRILQELTGGEVKHFCWPGGAYSDDSWPLAEEAGYATICVARQDRSRWNADDPRLVRRIGCANIVTTLGGAYWASDPLLLVDACEVELGRSWKKLSLRARKLAAAVRSGFSPIKD